jgi:hypothetical protein
MTDTTPSGLDDPIPVALALLDRQWPNGPALAEEAGLDAATALERDPRYVIGRLQQALSTLLAVDLSPMDAQTSLLSQAIARGCSLACRPDPKLSVPAGTAAMAA